MRAVLELSLPSGLLVDLRTLHPQVVLGLSAKEIGNLAVVVAGRQTVLAECCRVKRDPGNTDEVILAGATRQASYAGCRMDGGRLVVAGDAGPFTGAEMYNGELEVLGNAGDCTGGALHGGLLRVHGNAGDWCGAALAGQMRGMDGGTIIIEGNVGATAGAGMRRGLIYVGGEAGDTTGWRMLAGTIIVVGSAGHGAGLGMRRGSLVTGTVEQVLPGFLLSGAADLEWLRIYARHLERLGGCVPPGWWARGMKRYTGDVLELGKGELIVYDSA